jgi:hypothetical protein
VSIVEERLARIEGVLAALRDALGGVSARKALVEPSSDDWPASIETLLSGRVIRGGWTLMTAVGGRLYADRIVLDVDTISATNPHYGGETRFEENGTGRTLILRDGVCPREPTHRMSQTTVPISIWREVQR